MVWVGIYLFIYLFKKRGERLSPRRKICDVKLRIRRVRKEYRSVLLLLFPLNYIYSFRGTSKGKRRSLVQGEGTVRGFPFFNRFRSLFIERIDKVVFEGPEGSQVPNSEVLTTTFRRLTQVELNPNVDSMFRLENIVYILVVSFRLLCRLSV